MAIHEIRVWRDVQVLYSYKVEAESEEEAIQQVKDNFDDDNYLEHRPEELMREFGEHDWETVHLPKPKTVYLTP